MDAIRVFFDGGRGTYAAADADGTHNALAQRAFAARAAMDAKLETSPLRGSTTLLCFCLPCGVQGRGANLHAVSRGELHS